MRCVWIILILAIPLAAADRYWTNTVHQTGYDPGDTVHLYGTFTDTLTVTNSGTAGNVITFQFEAGAKFSAASLAENAAFIQLGSYDYITIDGQSTGIIECTNNGTLLGAQVHNVGVNSSGDHVTVKNLTITNLYVREAFSNDSNRWGQCIVFDNVNDGAILNCDLSQADSPIVIAYSTGTHSNISVINNRISICNHGISISGSLTGAYFNDLDIASNRIDHMENWDNQILPESPIHLDAIIFWNQVTDLTGCLSNAFLHHNYIGPNITHWEEPSSTTAFFSIVNNPKQCVNARIYNNVSSIGPGQKWNNDMISGWGENAIIVNNSMTGTGAGICPHTNAFVFNNFIYGTGGIVEKKSGPVGDPNLETWHFANWDSNVFYNIGPTVKALAIRYTTKSQPAFIAGEVLTGQTTGKTLKFGYWNEPNLMDCRWSALPCFNNGETVVGTDSGLSAVIADAGTTVSEGTITWATWTNAFKQDLHTTVDAEPLVNTNTLIPLTNDTVLIGQGMNLSSLFSTDYAGNPRPATGPWTIGAYEVTSASTGAGTWNAVNARVGTIRAP